MSETGIEYVTRTWSPVVGCTPVSAGCAHCWARRLVNGRLRRHYPQGFECVVSYPHRLDQPLHWRKPQRVFVCPMADLFHEDVLNAFIAEVFWTMSRAFNHTFLVLTKRPERMRQWFMGIEGTGQDKDLAAAKGSWPLPNVHLGVSVENQTTANERIPLLLATPAAVRWTSLEPMLGPVDLSPWLFPPHDHVDGWKSVISGIVLGGESGPGARPMELDWVRKVRDDCQAAGVPFFFKQAIIEGRKVTMPALDGVEHREMA